MTEETQAVSGAPSAALDATDVLHHPPALARAPRGRRPRPSSRGPAGEPRDATAAGRSARRAGDPPVAGVVARARADPPALRPDGREPLRVPAWRCRRHGIRSEPGAPKRPGRPAVRRRAPGELRHVRLGRAHPDVRHERLRRDAAGLLRLGRQAARRQHGGGRPVQRAEGQGRAQGGSRRHGVLPGDHGGPQSDADHRRVERTAGRRHAAGPPHQDHACARRPSRPATSRAGARPTRHCSSSPRSSTASAASAPTRRSSRRSRQHEFDDVVDRFGPVYEEYLRTLQADRIALLAKYSFVDIAHKVVGVGSVGTRAVVLLLESGDGEPLLLQVKQANPSVLEPYLGASQFDNAGKRVVIGQRVMQAAGDPFLGWTRGSAKTPHDFYVRQLKDMKGSIDVTLLDKDGLIGYGQVCGAVLARAHARAGTRRSSPATSVTPTSSTTPWPTSAWPTRRSTPTIMPRSSPASSEPDGIRPGRPLRRSPGLPAGLGTADRRTAGACRHRPGSRGESR